MLSWYSNSPDRGKFPHSLQQFRYIFEPETAALAAKFRTPEQMEEISAACHEMAVAPTLTERAEADVRFHVGILRGSNNELLMPLGALIDSALNNLFVLITRQARDLHYAQDLHNNIERAMRTRKPNSARVAVQKLQKNLATTVDHGMLVQLLQAKIYNAIRRFSDMSVGKIQLLTLWRLSTPPQASQEMSSLSLRLIWT